jgi:type II secretion system (T2SS) protein G
VNDVGGQPSTARYAVALVVGIAGTALVGAGAGMLVLFIDRHVSMAWRWGAGATALAGLLVVVAATRLARLSPRRTLIAVLGALLVVPPVAQTVRTSVAGATVYAPGKRTTSDLVSLGFALEARAVDEGGYPTVASVDALAPLLEGRYIQRVPRVDGWDRPLRYESEGSGRDGSYYLGSAGPDGRWQHPRLADYRDLPIRHGDDLVYSNGSFLTSPGPSQ